MGSKQPLDDAYFVCTSTRIPTEQYIFAPFLIGIDIFPRVFYTNR